MQHFFTAVLAACLSVPVMAQDRSEGEITYTISMPLPAKFKQDMPDFAASMPDVLEKESVFVFKGRRALITINPEQQSQSDDGAVRIKFSSNSDQATGYLDMDNRELLYMANVEGQTYLYPASGPAFLKGVPEETGVKKKILGYECFQVVLKGAGEPVRYWYTTQLAAAGSPFGVVTDKGVILEMESAGISFKAEEVRFRKVEDKAVTPPADAKRLSAAEYQALKKK